MVQDAEIKKKVLMDLMGAMKKRSASKKFGKPDAVMVEASEDPKEESEESPDMESAEQEPSDEEKAKIEELYNRYCK